MFQGEAIFGILRLGPDVRQIEIGRGSRILTVEHVRHAKHITDDVFRQLVVFDELLPAHLSLDRGARGDVEAELTSEFDVPQSQQLVDVQGLGVSVC